MNRQEEKNIDIVVVSYNTPKELSMSLTSVELFTKNCKVIIVDNGDEDRTWREANKSGIRRKYICEGNLGFSKGVNRGVEEVETEWFGILPADCMLTKGWENRMMYQIPTLEKPGIVAPMCTQTSGTQGVEKEGLRMITKRVKRVILNGAVMRKEDFLKVGGMDEGFPNKGGNFSDDDLARRFINAGYNNYILNHLIFHNQARSYGGPNEEMMKDFKQGMEYYKRKWKDEMNY